MTQHYHNKGQKDASKGKYRPPGKGFLVDLLFGSTKREISDGQSYSQGWREGKRKKR